MGLGWTLATQTYIPALMSQDKTSPTFLYPFSLLPKTMYYEHETCGSGSKPAAEYLCLSFADKRGAVAYKNLFFIFPREFLGV